MKVAASGTHGQLSNAMLNRDLSGGPNANADPSAQPLSRTEYQAANRTPIASSQGNDAMRVENQSVQQSRADLLPDDQLSMSQPGKNVLEVQKKLINRGKSNTTNTIANKNVFDAVGSNGIFQVTPSVVRFAGFEANKTHTFKVRVVNNSPAP